MAEIDSKKIYELLSQMKASGQSPRSMQQTRALLSLVFRAAEEQGRLISNPIDKVRNPQSRENLIDPLTRDEVRRLLETHKDGIQSARLHIAVLCGLRQGEALGLQWKDIDFKNATLRVEKQIQEIEGNLAFVRLKTNRSHRVVMLGAETLEVLRKHKSIIDKIKQTAGSKWVENDLVFPDRFGTPTSPHKDYNAWKRALKICAISPKRLHDARHTAATLMYSQGVGIETISRVLGHSSSAITSRLYVHSAIEPLRHAAQTLNAIIN
jgi:integrase